jgi:hypothetical protein
LENCIDTVGTLPVRYWEFQGAHIHALVEKPE